MALTKGMKMRGYEKKYFEKLQETSFINRFHDYLTNGKGSTFSKSEKRLWREFKKLTLTPVLFKKEIEKHNILVHAIAKKENPFHLMKAVFIDTLATLEGKNPYSEKLSQVLAANASEVEDALYTLLEIGTMAMEVVNKAVKEIHINHNTLDHFIDLYCKDYFTNEHLLTNCNAQYYYTAPYYYQFPDDRLTGIEDIHLFYRIIKTNNSLLDETHIFFRLKKGRVNNFILTSNIRERISGSNKTIPQSCFLYGADLKKSQLTLKNHVESELNMLFQLAPIIHQYVQAKENTYTTSSLLSGGIEDIQYVLKKPKKKKFISECFISEHVLTRLFLKKGVT